MQQFIADFSKLKNLLGGNVAEVAKIEPKTEPQQPGLF